MKIRDTKKERSIVYGYLLSPTAMAVTVAVFAIVATNFAGRTGSREKETLKKAVTRASVQCCATEGRYPPNVEYLEKNYGVQVNYKKYSVSYGGFTSSVVPEVNIIPVER